MKVSVIIPCYKSELFLEKTFHEVEASLKDTIHEIILVNDYSPDGTYEVIKKIVNENENVTGINMAKNFGQHAALMAGFAHASGDIVLCMDDDGQTPACEIHKLLDSLDDNTDVVYAKYKVKKHVWYKNIGSYLNSKMTEWMLDKPKELYISSFFVARKYVVEEILKYNHSFPYVIGLVLRTTGNIKNVAVEHRERETGHSGYSVFKLVSLWMNGFTAFSVKPLRVADLLGLVTAVIGFGYMLFLIIRRLAIGYSAVMGWNSLISIILFIGGLLMMIMGMAGEYIGRTYLSINNAPQYVIREVCTKTEDGKYESSFQTIH
ncbi:MAG: glycosyltransferase [Lachnospiraceae bacterium]|nr:glycosyltransferase [Lachnospiraceae bacterium]